MYGSSAITSCKIIYCSCNLESPLSLQEFWGVSVASRHTIIRVRLYKRKESEESRINFGMSVGCLVGKWVHWIPSLGVADTSMPEDINAKHTQRALLPKPAQGMSNSQQGLRSASRATRDQVNSNGTSASPVCQQVLGIIATAQSGLYSKQIGQKNRLAGADWKYSSGPIMYLY